MIFITVGTHEQQFNRIIKEIDRLKGIGKIKENVFIQSGYSDYIPKNCEWKQLISYEEMNEYMSKSRIIITHGGPGSIFQCINYGKIPIVVPRNPKYDEHVDQHQIEFTKKLEEKKSVLAVYDIKYLDNIIENYDKLSNERKNKENSNSKEFIYKFSNLIESIICR